MSTVEQFYRVSGEIADPKKRKVTTIKNPTKMDDLRFLGLSENRTITILKAHDENGKLKLPESVKADKDLLKRAKDKDLVLVLSHAVMPEKYKGTLLGAIFNYDERIEFTTVEKLRQTGLNTGYYTSSDQYASARKSSDLPKTKRDRLVAA